MPAPRIARALPSRQAAATRLAFACRWVSTSSASPASSSASASAAAASRPVAPRAAPAKAVGTAAARAVPRATPTAAARPLNASSRTAAAAPAGGPPAADAGGGAAIPEAGSLSSSLAPPPSPSFASPDPSAPTVDWASSFHGLSTTPFAPEVAAVLMAPIDPQDVEIKPDGIVYLPEIKYRRILNLAFGPGGWGLAPRGDLAVGDKLVSREYALVVHGRFVGLARGECGYFGGEDSVVTAGEGCKSNALMRCCKDLGIASELWDPRFIRQFKQQHCREVWVEHAATKKKRQIWLRKDCPPAYPYALANSLASKVVR